LMMFVIAPRWEVECLNSVDILDLAAGDVVSVSVLTPTTKSSQLGYVRKRRLHIVWTSRGSLGTTSAVTYKITSKL
jgi:hypothetical protein